MSVATHGNGGRLVLDSYGGSHCAVCVNRSDVLCRLRSSITLSLTRAIKPCSGIHLTGSHCASHTMILQSDCRNMVAVFPAATSTAIQSISHTIGIRHEGSH